MTVEPVAQGGSVPATQADAQWASTGLEDFNVTDAVLPRIKIEHAEGMWSENLGGNKYNVLRFIPLGLIKQRVLFHHKVEDNDVPMCKSADFQFGYPNADAPQAKSFPWELSGFDQKDYPPDTEGNVKLPCDGCQLKEWGSNPTSDAPYCSEQWTVPIYFDSTGESNWMPAIMTLQKSSIKPIRSFLTAFAQGNKPPFLVIANGTLQTKQRGSVTYSVPSFSQEGESPRERWMEFSEQFKEMRTFLQRPPLREADGESAPSDNTNTAPPVAPEAPVAPVAPSVAAEPVQQATPAPVAAPVAAPQPVAPVVAAPAPPAAAPVAPSAPQPAAGSDLPF